MINNYIYQTLPFYDSVDKQNFKQKWMYKDLCSSYLICPRNRLLPFQINRPTISNVIKYVFLYNYDGTIIGDILPNINATDIKIVSAGFTDYITYYGNKDLSNNLSCGLYYIAVYDNNQYWYSEVFRVDCFDISTLGNVTPIDGHIPYNKNDELEVSNNTPLSYEI